MQVSQIYISDGGERLSPYLTQCVDRVKALYSNMKHVLYGKEALREFLVTKFDSEVVGAFDKLNPYAYKSDLGRYCLLYEFGGWYFDISVLPLTSVTLQSSVETLAFRDIQMYSGTCWACSIGVLFAQPKRPVFETAIRKVVENCRTQYYGITALCPTGPSLLGQAFALHGSNPNCIFGDLQVLTPLHATRNMAFVLPDGMMLALRKPSEGGDLVSLGATGTNNYNDFYNSRTVYRS